MSRRHLLLLLACMLLTPFLMGAYYGSCNKKTIGFYPNYGPVWPFRSAIDSTTNAKAIESQVKGTTLFVPWNDEFYSCPAGGCSPTNCPTPAACPINTTALTNHVQPFLDKWVSHVGSGFSLNAHVVLNLHHAGFGNPAVGPGHTRPLGVGSPVTRDAFKAFYDALYNIFKSPNYNDGMTGATWLISIGNEVNLHLGGTETNWSAYKSFYEEMKGYVQNGSIHPGMTVLVGVSSTFFSTPEYGGFYNLRNHPLYPEQPDPTTAWRIIELNMASDAYLWTYYPVDPGNGFRALNPWRVYNDFFWMDYVAWGWSKQVVLQEVGYPTHPALHGSTDTYYSPYSSGEEAQQVFVNEVMYYIQNPIYDPAYTIMAASWWSLIDFAGPDQSESECWFLAAIWGLENNVDFRRHICSMGLVRADNTNKAAWTTFKNAALDAPNW